MADNIVFDTIPSDTPLGGIFLEIDPSRALEGPVAVERKVLLMGQKLDSGTTPLLTPRRITSAQDAEVQFGRGSMLHRMALGMQAVFDEVGFLDVSAIALEDTGVAASATITVAGQAIESRVLNLYIAGEQVQVVVASGEDAAAIAKKINTVLAARTDLPVSSAVEDKVVTLTARNKGETGNGMEVAWQYFDDDRLPRGITVTISGGGNGVGALAGGSGAPDVAAALAAVDEQWFYTIISPYTDQNNLAKIEADMNGRWGGMNMKTGHVFNALNGTHAELTTFGNKRNSAHGSGWGLKGCPTWAPVLRQPRPGPAAEGGEGARGACTAPARPFQLWRAHLAGARRHFHHHGKRSRRSVFRAGGYLLPAECAGLGRYQFEQLGSEVDGGLLPLSGARPHRPALPAPQVGERRYQYRPGAEICNPADDQRRNHRAGA